MPKGRLLRRIEQLKPCNCCAATGGSWKILETGQPVRCHCLRGRLLAKSDEIKQKRTTRT